MCVFVLIVLFCKETCFFFFVSSAQDYISHMSEANVMGGTLQKRLYNQCIYSGVGVHE